MQQKLLMSVLNGFTRNTFNRKIVSDYWRTPAGQFMLSEYLASDDISGKWEIDQKCRRIKFDLEEDAENFQRMINDQNQDLWRDPKTGEWYDSQPNW